MVSIEFLRGVLGLFAIGCAYMTGRAAVGVRKGWVKKRRLYAWIIRTVACLVGMSLRHPLGTFDVVFWVLTAALFALGYWNTSRARKEEDLTHTIFPEP